MPKTTQNSPPSSVRIRQVADAQNVFRKRKKDEGCRRLQEWVPEETLAQLRAITQRTGMSRAKLLGSLVEAVYLNKIDVKEVMA
ncbi:hypothetical protein GCM10007860_25380 [Chitiniphilus shinanonensis]|uniref:Protein CopB n=1 Tax=Chitiniphilus shinanonensis TaxID=553088 RepID=A0ABQ6BVK2_9NEIS|nr:hypothetical protein [Chitiniphilus shinanonensis]GLS05386.1 hypothetical protein GCM10007860_25380 [Chitiniphilus shinanonensis]